jgi:hypothetical protein
MYRAGKPTSAPNLPATSPNAKRNAKSTETLWQCHAQPATPTTKEHNMTIDFAATQIAGHYLRSTAAGMTLAEIRDSRPFGFITLEQLTNELEVHGYRGYAAAHPAPRPQAALVRKPRPIQPDPLPTERPTNRLLQPFYDSLVEKHRAYEVALMEWETQNPLR